MRELESIEDDIERDPRRLSRAHRPPERERLDLPRRRVT
jgi:hypothetical protein